MGTVLTKDKDSAHQAAEEGSREQAQASQGPLIGSHPPGPHPKPASCLHFPGNPLPQAGSSEPVSDSCNPSQGPSAPADFPASGPGCHSGHSPQPRIGTNQFSSSTKRRRCSDLNTRENMGTCCPQFHLTLSPPGLALPSLLRIRGGKDEQVSNALRKTIRSGEAKATRQRRGS